MLRATSIVCMCKYAISCYYAAIHIHLGAVPVGSESDKGLDRHDKTGKLWIYSSIFPVEFHILVILLDQL